MDLFKQLPQEIETMIFRNVHELNFIKVNEQIIEHYCMGPSRASKHYYDDYESGSRLRKINRRYRYHWGDVLVRVMKNSIFVIRPRYYRSLYGVSYEERRIVRDVNSGTTYYNHKSMDIHKARNYGTFSDTDSDSDSDI